MKNNVEKLQKPNYLFSWQFSHFIYFIQFHTFYLKEPTATKKVFALIISSGAFYELLYLFTSSRKTQAKELEQT